MSCDRCKETLEEIELLRSENEELRSECDLLRELEDDFDKEKRKFQGDIEKLTKVSKQSIEHLQREKKAADVLRTKLKRLETQNTEFSSQQITLERRNDDFQQESRVLKSRLRALEEKIEADLEESVFVKYELEDVRAEYEHLKQEHLEDLGAANAIRLRCNSLSAEVAAKADVIKNLKSSNKSLEKTIREMIEAQEKSSLHKTMPTRNKKKPPRVSLLSVLPSLKRPRPRSAECSPTASTRRRSMRKSMSIPFGADSHRTAELPPMDPAAAAAAAKLAQKLSNGDVTARSTSAPVPREHQKLDPNLLRRSLQDLYSEQQQRKKSISISSDRKDNAPYLPTVDEEQPPVTTELMCDSPSPPRRVKKSPVIRGVADSGSGGASGSGSGSGSGAGNENPEHAADTDASTDEMDISTMSEDELNLGNSAQHSRSSSSSSKNGVNRKLTYSEKSKAADRAENPEEGSNTDTDMHDQELLLSRSSLIGSALRKASASSLSKKRKRSPRKSSISVSRGSGAAAVGVFRAELVEQANQIAAQIQRFSEALQEAAVISDLHSPIKSPPLKRRSGSIDRTHTDTAAASASSSSSTPAGAPTTNGVIDDADTYADGFGADLLPMEVFEDLALASLSLLAHNAAANADYSTTFADENGDLDSLSRSSEDAGHTKGSSLKRALFRMINSRVDASPNGSGDAAGAASSSTAAGAATAYDVDGRVADLEERLEVEIAARLDLEAQNDALLFELQRSRAEVRDLQILLERLSTDDEAMATSAPAPTPASSSPRKQSLAGGADAMLPFSLMDSSMLPAAHQSAQSSSPAHTLRRGRSLLSNSDRVSQPPSLRRTQTTVSPMHRGGRGSQPPSLRRSQIASAGTRISPRSVGPGIESQPASLRRGASAHVSPQLACSPMGQLPSPLLRGHASGGSRSLLTRNGMIRSPVSQPIVSPSANAAFNPQQQQSQQKPSDGDRPLSISLDQPRSRRAIRKPSSLTRLLTQDDNATGAGGGSAASSSAASSAATSKPSNAATSSTDVRESRPAPEAPSTSSEARSGTRRSAAETRSFREMTRGLKMPCKPKSNDQKRRLQLAELIPPEVSTRTPNGSQSKSSNSSSSTSSSLSSKPTSASLSVSSSSSPSKILSPITSSAKKMMSSSSAHPSHTDQVVNSAAHESPSPLMSPSRPLPQKIDAQKAASDFLRKAALTENSKSAWPSREATRGSVGNALMSTKTPAAPTSSSSAAEDSTSAKPKPSASGLVRRKRRSVTRQAKSMLPSPQASVGKRSPAAPKAVATATQSESNSTPRTLAGPRTSREAIDTLMMSAPYCADSPESSPPSSTTSTPRGTLKKQNSAKGPSLKHSRRSLPSALNKSKSATNVTRPRSSLATKKSKARTLVEMHSRTSAPSSRRSSQQDDVTLPITPEPKPAPQPTQHVRSPSSSRVPVLRRTPRGSAVMSPAAAASVVARRDSAGVRRPGSKKRSNELLRKLKESSTAPAPISAPSSSISSGEDDARSPTRPPRPELRKPKSQQVDRHPLRHRSLAANRRKSSGLTSGLATRSTSPKIDTDAPVAPHSAKKRSSLSKGASVGIKSPAASLVAGGKRGVTPPSSRLPASKATSGTRSASSSRRSSGVSRGESLRNLVRTPTPELPLPPPPSEEPPVDEHVAEPAAAAAAVKSPSKVKTPSPLAARPRTVLRPKSGIRVPQRRMKR